MIIGLTGGSGTGKSTAGSFFKDRGFLVIDADKVSRKVCSKGEKCLLEIKDSFGENILDSEGNLKRQVLGDIVFNDKAKLNLLNKITHKYIIEEICNIVSQNKCKNIVLDAPLLFETDLHKMCDINICILSNKENRINRIMLRDGISKEQAFRRIESQKDDEYYISRSDYAIYNDLGVSELEGSLKDILGGNNA